MKSSLLTGCFLAVLLATTARAEPSPFASSDAAALRKLNARFAETDLSGDISALPENERQALIRLIQAAQRMNALFLRQSWAGNPALLLRLLADTSPLGRERMRAFITNKGPWLRLDHQAAFMPGVPEKPAAGNFYPAGATKAEVEAWLKTLNDAQRKTATGFFTTIRRGVDGKFMSVPYSVEYQGELAEVAKLCREAAQLTAQPSLKKYLNARADAFLSNDYYDSDVAWMELDASIEPTLGPYEVYEDEWFNAKAAFEGYVTLRDDAETKKLERFSAELQALENALPIDPALRNPKLGALAPIRVVNSIYSSGDGHRGVLTAAFNLPNDERITSEMGAKRVMLKNVQEAKFKQVLLPIAKVVLAPADRKNVAFDVFFTHILMHELMHGLGPHNIKVGGKATTVRQELQATSSPIEEAKADVAGLWALQQLIDRGVLEKTLEKTMYTTYLASMFRSIRFGINEAHGRGIALQLNAFLDAGAVQVAKDGTFHVVPETFETAVTNLTRELMTLQAAGDRAKAEALLTKMAVLRPDVQRVLEKLKNVPVDVTPRFHMADALIETQTR